MMNDIEAYQTFTGLRHWYNKLWFSERMGYTCGPASIPPKESGWYITRPIINLSGMGAGAKKVWIEKGDHHATPLGHFWCQFFEGRQYSVTYEWIGFWHPVSSWEGIKSDEDLTKFHRWERSDFLPTLSSAFDELSEVCAINVEFIDNKPIEAHLRTSPDPDYDVLIPIWQNEEYVVDMYRKMGYSYIDSFDDAEGFLDRPRIGFMVKNFK